MTEFTKGIYNAIRNSMDESFILSVIFFIGHIIIAMVVVAIITGASIWQPGAVALIEPNKQCMVLCFTQTLEAL